MASTLPSTSDKQRPDTSSTVKRRLITSTWFIMALLISALTLAVWVFSSAPAFETKSETLEESSVEETVLNIGQINHIDDVKQLEDAVQPISFDALVKDLRDYPPEFKDFKYLEANKGKWTVQVMDVSEHEVVTDYLSTRKDREKFAYFRYRDSDNQARYLLTYGAMASPQMAMGAAKTVDFKLPANVRVLPEEIDRYRDLIENYELSTGTIKDLSNDSVKQVKLQPTSRELAAKRKNKTTTEHLGDSKSDVKNDDTSNNSDSETASKAAADENVESPEVVENDIKGSTDTEEVLSVVEDRKLVDPVEDNITQPKLPKKPDTPVQVSEPAVNPVIEQPPVPAKPNSTQPNSTKPNSTKTNNSQPNNAKSNSAKANSPQPNSSKSNNVKPTNTTSS